MNSLSKNMYIDKSDDIVNKYNNAFHSTIKMKPIDIKSSTYTDFNKKIIRKMLNLKFVMTLRNILAKGYTPNWSEEVFVIKKVNNNVLWTYIISDLNNGIVGTFYKKELQKPNQKEFRAEKVKVNR